MQCKFHIGQQVVCIINEWWDAVAEIARTRQSYETYPEHNKVYTIRTLECANDRVYIRLKEIVNPHRRYKDSTGEIQFEHTAFKPLDINEQKYDISVFTDLLKTKKIELVSSK